MHVSSSVRNSATADWATQAFGSAWAQVLSRLPPERWNWTHSKTSFEVGHKMGLQISWNGRSTKIASPPGW